MRPFLVRSVLLLRFLGNHEQIPITLRFLLAPSARAEESNCHKPFAQALSQSMKCKIMLSLLLANRLNKGKWSK